MVLSTLVNAFVVGVVGLVLAWLARGQFEVVRQRLAEIDRRFDAVDRRFEGLDVRIDRLEQRFDARLDAMQTSIDSMRSDVMQVALAIGARPRATNA